MNTGRGKAAWHEDDELWAALAVFLFDADMWRQAEEESKELPRLLRISPPAALLDLGCGPGRYAIPLARHGYRVTGVDRTEAYLEEADRRAAEAGVEIELLRDDMRDFRRPGAFDAVISMQTSLGFFEDPQEDVQVLRNVHASLGPRGAVLIHTMGKEILGRIFQPTEWREIAGETWLYERRVADGWSRMHNRWIRYKDGERSEYHIDHRLFSAQELRDLLHGSGFDRTEVYGGLDGSAYDHEAQRLVVIGRKEG